MTRLEVPKTIFADFGSIDEGKRYVEALREAMDIGNLSINAPTANGGCRVAVQVEANQVKSAGKLVIAIGGQASPDVVRATRERKQHKVGACPHCGLRKKDVPGHIARRHAAVTSAAVTSGGGG